MQAASSNGADGGNHETFGADSDDGLLRKAAINEMIAPEILPFETKLITKTKEFIFAEV